MPSARKFFSSNAARASDGTIVIALFNGRGRIVALVKGSVDAALGLCANCLAAVVDAEESGSADDR